MNSAFLVLFFFVFIKKGANIWLVFRKKIFLQRLTQLHRDGVFVCRHVEINYSLFNLIITIEL